MSSTKNDEAKFAMILETLIKILNKIERIAIIWIISYYVYLSIKSLSGTTTIANIVLSFFMDKTVAEKLSYVASGCFGTGWFFERRNKKKLIKIKAKEINDLISQIDKNKGTSNLTEYGETNKNDE